MKALARAHRWLSLPEGGEYGSIEELARAERINPSYLARALRLTLLAPEIVESVLNGHDPDQITLERLNEAVPGDMGRTLRRSRARRRGSRTGDERPIARSGPTA